MAHPDPELLSLTASLDGLARRITALAEQEASAGREDVAGELYEVERTLGASLRRLNRITNKTPGNR